MPREFLAGKLHDGLVLTRRANVLAKHVAAILPANARVLDVGCGDGMIDSLVQQRRRDVRIEGIDVLVRPSARIPVKPFDGTSLSYPDASFDVVMFVDVLHHTVDPLMLLKEATRVAQVVVIKDHLRDGFLANTRLRFMDWFGNKHYGVALPYNYWSGAQWEIAFRALAVDVTERMTFLGLYPAPASWLFERGLHFMARLEKNTLNRRC